MITTSQDIMTWFGLSAMDALATAVQQLAEQHVKDHLGWQEIEQQTWIEYLPLEEGQPCVNDPPYVVDGAHVQAVPGAYFQPNVIQLRNVPVRSITNFWEDPTGYFGQSVGAFAAPALTSGADFYLKTEQDGLSWSGQVVRRTFGAAAAPGSMKIEYVAGFTAAELAGRWSVFKTAIQATAADLYLRGKAVAIGHFSNIAAETDGGGVSVSYYKNRLAGCPVPDEAADMLEPYVFYGNMAL